MPDRGFEYLPQAIEEAWEAYHWYRERSETAAENFLQSLRQARQTVTERPRGGGSYSHGTRCRRLWRFPYGLIYVERDDRIVAIAVAHLKRRPGYWRKRIN
jgi:plasmid stabilization system protein ParE